MSKWIFISTSCCTPPCAGPGMQKNASNHQDFSEVNTISEPPVKFYTNAIGRIRNSHGLSLIEMMIVIAIIAILGSTSVMSYIIARDKARVASCYVTLESVKQGLEGYYVEYNEYPKPEAISTFADMVEVLRDHVDFSPHTTCDDNIEYQARQSSYQLVTAVHYTGGKVSFGLKLTLENGEISEEPL